ncbi:MAG: 4-amino-4-deoxy-L-arabinose transferase [Nocardioides sp.]|nr:4-amino-4-deoxy-L-arabinose transferase [Nocardioides sp.]
MLATSRPATLGKGRLICIDGPAGAGKTRLAADLGTLAGAPVVHMDDLYEGWTGLPRLTDQFDSLLLPLASGAPGSYRRYDWHRGAYAETVSVPPAPLLVLEGVGSAAAAYAHLQTAVAWVEAPLEVRRRRALDRDGATFAPHWDGWAAAEAEHFTRERTRERADLVVVTG